LLPHLRVSWPSCRRRVKVEARRFWDIRHTLSVEYGVVLRGDQIVIQQALRESMMQKAHDGHLGLVKTKALARQHMWWPGMSKVLDQRDQGLPYDHINYSRYLSVYWWHGQFRGKSSWGSFRFQWRWVCCAVEEGLEICASPCGSSHT
jgi:hypothetical protein